VITDLDSSARVAHVYNTVSGWLLKLNRTQRLAR
jgi:hypothetical protein